MVRKDYDQGKHTKKRRVKQISGPVVILLYNSDENKGFRAIALHLLRGGKSAHQQVQCFLTGRFRKRDSPCHRKQTTFSCYHEREKVKRYSKSSPALR